MKKFNKICAGFLMCGLLASGGLLAGCFGGGGDTEPLETTTDVYAFAGASAGILAQNEEFVAGASSVSASSVFGATPLDDIKSKIQAAISGTMDEYMNLFDSVVGDSKPVETSKVESDKAGYAHKLSIKTNSLNGETTVELYYNETAKTSETEVENSDEFETATRLNGLIIVNDNEEKPLYFTGAKEVEIEGNEVEVEVEFAVSLTENDTENKIVFKQAHETENGVTDEEYVYEIYLGGTKITEFAFDMEKNSNGKVELEYEQQIAGVSIKFDIEKTSDNSFTIKTNNFSEIDGVDLELSIVVTKKDNGDGSFSYVYTIPALLNFSFEGSAK
ncbi:MAG: hypothetical protein J6K39_04460 [Clostridia bacterium]|nr:hypothetical protein [Clostridia bacterium]